MNLRAFLAAILTSTLVSAQIPAPVPPKDEAPFVLHSTTRLVQVSVIVQNRSGQPVADLKKEDFQLRDNGRPQAISLFSVDATGNLPSGTAAQQRAAIPANVFTNEMEQKPGVPSSVTIILLDGLNTRFEDQAYSRNQVVKFLQTIQPGDHVGLYVLGRGLKVLHDFTSDSTDLIEKLKKYNGQNLPDLAASEQPVIGDTLQLDNWFRGAGGSGVEADYFTVNRVLGTLRALEFISNHLAGIPGRKNLIWVSGGFPLDIGYDSIEALNNPAREQRTFTEEEDRAVRAINNANVAIYPVDARGLVADHRFDASNRTIDLAPKLGPNPIVKNQQTMQELASRTGGRAYYNTNDLNKAIRDAVSDSRVTYTLGYYPADEKFDNKFHKLDVKVPGVSGLNVRFRKGYFDQGEKTQDIKARKTEINDAVIDPLEASGLGLIVAVKPDPSDKSSIQLFIKVDQKQISLEPNGDRWAGRLDMVFVQKNDRGKQFGGIDDTVDLNLQKVNYDKLVKEGMVYRKAITLDPQAKEIRVVVRDVPSGNIGSVTIPFSQIVRK